jgi:hypothetical protein
MFSQYKKILAIFGIVAFLVSTLFTVSFADDDSKKRRYDRYDKKQERHDKRHDKRHDRDDSDDSDDSDDDLDDDSDSDSDDDGVTQPPIVVPPVVEPPVVEPPVVEPPVVEPPVVEPPVVEPPVVEPPALDGNQVYQENCAGCHGSGKKGNNVPSWHLGDKVNLTPEEIDAINGL